MKVRCPGRKEPRKFLGAWDGVLQTDGYQASVRSRLRHKNDDYRKRVPQWL
jgi:hypothetical protein